MELQNLSQILINALLALVIAVSIQIINLARKFINMKLVELEANMDAKAYKQLTEFIQTGVYAMQQLEKTGIITDKKTELLKQAYEQARKLGIELSDEQMNILLEGVVNRIKSESNTKSTTTSYSFSTATTSSPVIDLIPPVIGTGNVVLPDDVGGQG